MAKYVAKGDGLPAFLYAERPRSVKVIRTSKGFWGDSVPKLNVDRHEPSPQLDAYRPIGESLRQSDSTSIIQDEDGKYRSKKIPLDELPCDLRDAGYRVIERCGSWLELKRDGGRSGASRRPPSLHLRRRQNRGS